MNETWVTVFGNVADDPRLFQASTGPAASFRVAQTPRSERNGVWSDGTTTFFDVTCFGRLGEHVAGSVVRGDPVVVHGRLSMREWQRDERRGKEASITANHVGHDLLYGTSTFRRPRRESGSGDHVPSQGSAPQPAPAGAPSDGP